MTGTEVKPDPLEPPNFVLPDVKTEWRVHGTIVSHDRDGVHLNVRIYEGSDGQKPTYCKMPKQMFIDAGVLGDGLPFTFKVIRQTDGTLTHLVTDREPPPDQLRREIPDFLLRLDKRQQQALDEANEAFELRSQGK